jgi:hypothetical protein
MDCMNLRNESTLRVVLVGISIGPTDPDVFGLSDTKHIHRNAQSCIGISTPTLRH